MRTENGRQMAPTTLECAPGAHFQSKLERAGVEPRRACEKLLARGCPVIMPLGCVWGFSGSLLEAGLRPLGGRLRASWGIFLGLFGASWGPWGLWGACWRSRGPFEAGSSKCHFEFQLLGPSWSSRGASFGHLWGLLGAARGLLGACWRSRGSSWGGRLTGPLRVPPLGGLLGRLGASEGRKGDNVKNIEKHNENQ